jgi:hypothetical protein
MGVDAKLRLMLIINSKLGLLSVQISIMRRFRYWSLFSIFYGHRLTMMTFPTTDPTAAKKRSWLITLAFVGAFQPTPIPLTFLHKLYLGQYGWGVVYFLLGFTQISRIACAVEGIWYLLNPDLTASSMPWSQWVFPRPGQSTVVPLTSASITSTAPVLTGQMASALRELEQLRQEGLLSESEFEQKRRQVLDLG